MKRLIIWGLLIGTAVLLFNEANRTRIPLGLTAFDVWVVDLTTGEQVLAGKVESNYHTGDAGLRTCRAVAADFAADQRLRAWDYGCCAVTTLQKCDTRLR